MSKCCLEVMKLRWCERYRGWSGDFETADAGDGSLDITGAGVLGGTYAELDWRCVNVIGGNGSLDGMWV